MTRSIAFSEYYRHTVSAGRRGDPTFDEARIDYRRVIDAQLSAWRSRF
jgi:hypothetical protein